MSDILRESSQALLKLLFVGLEHGVDSVRASGGPLIPFAMYEHGGKCELIRVVAERLEDSIAQARAMIRKLSKTAERYVLVYDGSLMVDGVKHTAVYAEAAERGKPKGACLAQSYRPGKSFWKRFATIGNPVDAGEVENLLR